MKGGENMLKSLIAKVILIVALVFTMSSNVYGQIISPRTPESKSIQRIVLKGFAGDILRGELVVGDYLTKEDLVELGLSTKQIQRIVDGVDVEYFSDEGIYVIGLELTQEQKEKEAEVWKERKEKRANEIARELERIHDVVIEQIRHPVEEE